MSITHINTSNSIQALHWSQRPPLLIEAIDEAFERIRQDATSSWGVYNGDSNYELCGVKEHPLMKELILEALAKDPDQKVFYAIDIGAGDFQWGNALANYLNDQTDLPPDIHIHIIGIRGERYRDKPRTDLGRCTLHCLGGFKVEELESEFKKRGLPELKDKIDLIVSHWCLRHLADPLGTVFSEAYPLLRPKTGILLIDGFCFLYGNESMDQRGKCDMDIRLTHLFLETHAPCISRHHEATRSMNHYMLRRPDDSPLRLNMQYKSVEFLDRNGGYQIGSNTVTCFTPLLSKFCETFRPVTNWPRPVDHIGDKQLHEWLKQKHLLANPLIAWQPLLERDIPLSHPPLHQAILEKDKIAVIRCLEKGCDINESDSFGTMTWEQYDASRNSLPPTGRTPLHLALETENLTLFKALLWLGADSTLPDGNGKSVLHLAAANEAKKPFLEALFSTPGLDLNLKLSYTTPLEEAIEGNNFFAVEAFLKKGVVPTERQIKQLKEANFSHPLLPMSCTERPEFKQVIEHIKAGNTVRFTATTDEVGYIFEPKTTIAPHSELIIAKLPSFDSDLMRAIEEAIGFDGYFVPPLKKFDDKAKIVEF